MTRRITAHKGGRTARAPEARMTPAERERLEAVLQHYSAKYVNWLIDHVEADYAEITQGDDTMADEIKEGQRVSVGVGRGKPRQWGYYTGFSKGNQMQIRFDDGMQEMVDSDIVRGEKSPSSLKTQH